MVHGDCADRSKAKLAKGKALLKGPWMVSESLIVVGLSHFR